MAEKTTKASQDEAREAKIIEKTRVFQCFLIFGLSSPRCLQKIPAEPQDTPTSAQHGSKTAQDGPKTAPRPPKIAQDGAQDGPTWLQDGPTWPQDCPQTAQAGPRWPPRCPQSAPKPLQDAAGEQFGSLQAPKSGPHHFKIGLRSSKSTAWFPPRSLQQLGEPFSAHPRSDRRGTLLGPFGPRLVRPESAPANRSPQR